MALNSQITNAAELIAKDINAGAGSARQSLGGGAAFGQWTEGLPRTLANYVETATAAGMSFPVVTVKESGTPATIVGEGLAKPHATTIATTDAGLVKFAGYSQGSLESFLTGAGLAGAMASTLAGSCLKAYELHAIAQLDAAGGTPVTGTTWPEALAAAQAQILGAGGIPSVVVVSALDYGKFVGGVSTSAGFAQDVQSPIGAFYGSPIHVSSGAPAGKAYVLDSSSVLAVQHEQSPIMIIDVSSQAHLNLVRLVADLVATTIVVDPSKVVEVTAPAAAGTASASKSK